MAYIHFDSSYAPCGFLIVPDNGSPYANDTPVIDSDWEWPSLARLMGWEPKVFNNCTHETTDGTVDCRCCGKEAHEFMSEAYDYISANRNKNLKELDRYLEEANNGT